MTQETTPPLERIGRYQVLEKLGEGGMGAVYLAHDTVLHRQVALKLLPAESVADPGAVARFRREAQVLARLTHPHIVHAHDSGEDGGRHFLVMEYIAGRSLAAELAEHGRIPPTLAADCVSQAALALDHAHKQGVVHRDLKPSNLLLARDGQVKLLDLGLARFLQDQIGDSTLTQAGSGMGTPDYCPPEQSRDAHKADVRSDVYALGCTLYHLIAGRVPFPGSSRAEKARAHERQEPTPLEELCPETPGGLVLVVQRMMAKRPADRFQSAAEVHEALVPYAAGSSKSFARLKNTTTWDGSRLATQQAFPRRMRSTLAWVGTATAAVLVGAVAALLGGFATGLLRLPGPEVVQAPTPPIPDGAPDGNPAQPPPPDPPLARNVLTVSQKPEGGGRYRTINEALERVQPGQTIRIVDNAQYQETVVIQGAQHQGITLEATRGAILEIVTNRGSLITLSRVDGVVLRRLRLTARGTEMCALVTVAGACTGLVLDEVEFRPAPQGGTFIGVEVSGVPRALDAGRPNLLVTGCRFHKAFKGINLVGITALGEQYGAARPIHDVLICGTQFANCTSGLILKGEVHRTQVVGNRFQGCLKSAWQCEHLLEPSGEILIANNTAFECSNNLRVWDNAVRTAAVRLHNNLSLRAPYPDALAIDSGGKAATSVGMADGSVYPKKWNFSHNWREVKVPTPLLGKPDGWIPGGERDVIQESIPGVNRDPKSPDFLRPDPQSPLATQGAGKEDPTLPPYVGALPPEGVAPWDWSRTWRARRSTGATQTP